MMLWCRAGRRCAALALDPALRLPGSCAQQAKANTPKHVTATLRKGHAFLWCRSLRGPGARADAHLGTRQSDLNRDSRFANGDWGHAAARTVHRRTQACPAWLPGDGGVTTRSMHSRASSTAAAARRSDAGGEEQRAAGSNKTGQQESKEASGTTSSTEKTPEESEPEEGKPNKTQQLKKVFKEYGAVGVSFHIGISLMSLGMFYLLVSSGIDMAAMLCKLGFSEAVVRSKMAAGTSTFVLSYAIHKLFAPVRISITLVSVPLIVRYFRKTGLFKPPAP